MAFPLRDLVQKVDDFIRLGRVSEARAELRQVRHRKVPRALALPMAGLARRAGLPGTAIRILHPVVRPTNPSAIPASDMEKAEYAAALTYLGASDESLGLLRGLNAEKAPQVRLFHSFALFAQWDYKAAIPLLTQYIASPLLTDYQRLVGKVNLAAALVQEREHAAAVETLREILETTKKGGFHLLHGNCLELASQNAVYHGDWEQAGSYLAQAEEILKHGEGLSLLFVRKWKSIARLLKEGAGRDALVALEKVRAEARERQHWETVRECDLFQAVATKAEPLALHLYFGTPFPSYRQRILSLFGNGLTVPDEYAWKLGGETVGGPALQVAKGEYGKKQARLKNGQVVHRLLVILASDFYTPSRLALLFGKLYPGEFYNPATSAARVYRIVRRLRGWFSENGMPLDVPEVSGTYRLVAEKPLRLIVQRELAPGESLDLNLKRLKETWPEKAFSAAEAGKILHLSTRSALRVLSKGQKEGTLLREGAAAATRYKFAS